MLLVDKLAWIEINNRKILSTRSFGKEKFYLPGGKREIGESDEQALYREIEEELSVQLDLDSLNFIGIFEAQADQYPIGTLIRMTCYTAKYVGTLAANSEIEELRWLDSTDMLIISDVDKLIFDFLKQNNLID